MKSPFRNRRHKLFDEGKLLRYIGYVVGVIGLIIIGIIMILQLNIWTEDSKVDTATSEEETSTR